MFCKFTEKNLSAYMDGETSRPASYIIKGHLTACPACKRKFELLQAVSGAVKKEPELLLNAEFMENLRRRIAAGGCETRRLRPALNLKLILGAFGLLLALTGGIIISGLHEGKSRIAGGYGTLEFQTKADIVCSGTGVEYATFSSQTGR